MTITTVITDDGLEPTDVLTPFDVFLANDPELAALMAAEEEHDATYRWYVNHTPTPAEIATACAQIQAGWSPVERSLRQQGIAEDPPCRRRRNPAPLAAVPKPHQATPPAGSVPDHRFPADPAKDRSRAVSGGSPAGNRTRSVRTGRGAGSC